MSATNRVSAQSRDAGRNVVHTVTDWYGHPAINGTRRSAHSYNYAICRRSSKDGQPVVIVERWSKSPRCSSSHFPVEVQKG